MYIRRLLYTITNRVYRVELPLSIIVGCLPTLQPLVPVFRRLWSKQQMKKGYQIQNEAYVLHPSQNSENDKKAPGVGVESFRSSTERQSRKDDLV